MAVVAWPVCPAIPSVPVVVRRRRDLTTAPTTKKKNAARDRVTVTIAEVEIARNGRILGVDQHHRAKSEGDHPTSGENAMRWGEDVGYEQQQGEADQHETRDVDRERAETEQREEQEYATSDTWQNRAGVRQLEESVPGCRGSAVCTLLWGR